MKLFIFSFIIFGALILGCARSHDNPVTNTSSNAASGGQDPQTPVQPVPGGSPVVTFVCGEQVANAQSVEACHGVNKERTTMGLSALEWNATLATVAQAHADDMFTRNYFSHMTPEGLSPFDRMRNAGVVYRTAGENIALGYRDGASVVTGWMNSSGHKANILNPDFRRHGVGYSNGYWVQVFSD